MDTGNQAKRIKVSDNTLSGGVSDPQATNNSYPYSMQEGNPVALFGSAGIRSIPTQSRVAFADYVREVPPNGHAEQLVQGWLEAIRQTCSESYRELLGSAAGFFQVRANTAQLLEGFANFLVDPANLDTLQNAIQRMVRQRQQQNFSQQDVLRAVALFQPVFSTVASQHGYPTGVSQTVAQSIVAICVLESTTLLSEEYLFLQRSATEEEAVCMDPKYCQCTAADIQRIIEWHGTEGHPALKDRDGLQAALRQRRLPQEKTHLQSKYLIGTGAIVANRYSIVAPIESGSFKDGWLALDLQRVDPTNYLPAQVYLGTLKCLQDEMQSCSPAQLARMKAGAAQEMYITRRLHEISQLQAHPLLVTTHDVSRRHEPAEMYIPALERTIKGHFIVQELCVGGDLYGYLSSLEPFEEPLACHLFRQLVDGVQALHAANFFHGDLKIENVLLKKHPDGDYSLVIGDFGLTVENHEMNSVAASTALGVVPPETRRRSDGTAVGVVNKEKADVYACGLILLWMVGLKAFHNRRILGAGRVLDLFKRYAVSADASTPAARNDALGRLCTEDGLQVSSELLEVLRGMLCADASYRFTFERVLNSAWVEQNEPLPRHVVANSLQRRLTQELLQERNAQIYEPTAAEILRETVATFDLLKAAIRKREWDRTGHPTVDVEQVDARMMISITTAEHTITCQVQQREKNVCNIHIKWVLGVHFAVFAGVYLDLLNTLQELDQLGLAAVQRVIG
ncbi:hypothetical protein CYMTET_22932 [Cymbomonas tetramitiformis]|uniref:Protein kinase domain-containing protein n=1 Tax=Cymbomonas tetramitiformis TaxID=36881 RepID=A0AAE0FYW7_9CHLO|nr:hypothetical protein CYMTET_22932 [Cymbomonas tetramitiformis]